jgi:hypothetical protein
LHSCDSSHAECALEIAEEYDLIVLDEAHHARRRGAGTTSESGPNALLRLMRALKERTQGLVLLTATPMQVHPVEVFDLLSLLGMPPEWSEPAFLRYFDEVLQDSPSHEAFDHLAAMFRAVERTYGEVPPSEMQRMGITSSLRAKSVLRRYATVLTRHAECWRPPTERRPCG